MNLRSFNKRTVNYQIFTFLLFVSTMIFTENPIYKLCISFVRYIVRNTMSNINTFNTFVIMFLFFSILFNYSYVRCASYLYYSILYNKTLGERLKNKCCVYSISHYLFHLT